MGVTLSIIVPVYNVCGFLNKCIDSILAQTFTDFELIIVDDGSTDGSAELCDTYQERDSRVKVIHKENGGVVSARKAGISAAQGKYAGYVDGDDWIESDMYEKMVQYMEQYGCDLVMCDIFRETKRLPLSSGGTVTDIDGGYYSRERLEKEIFPKMIYAGEFYKFGVYPVIWNKLYRREKLIEHQTAVDDTIKTGEDAACVYPYLLDAENMYFIKGTALYHYRNSENQMTAAYDSRYFDRFKSLYKFLSNSEIAKSPYSAQLDYYFAYLIKMALSNELKAENPLPSDKKTDNISEICAFANSEGFTDRINISPGFHRLYFRLVKKNRPHLLAAGIYMTKFVQRVFGRR